MSETTPDAELEIAREAAALAWAVWRRTDFDRVDTHRSLDDEFASRISSAADTGTVASFLNRLARKWGIRSVPDSEDEVRRIIHKYDGEGGPPPRRFLRVARQNKALIVLEMKDTYQDSDNDSGTIQRRL